MDATQRLMRSRTDTVIGGVAGGIARYVQIDPVLVRLAFVVLAFSGVTVLLYPLLWIIMPLEPERNPQTGDTTPLRADPRMGQPDEPEFEIPINNVGSQQPRADEAQRRSTNIGIVLLALGTFFMLQMLVPMSLKPFLLPMILIGLGVFLWQRARTA
ncbi:MAG: PspC domain-containing protein [Chloroflexaceae bacterium]|jgi:phage shock protein C|nr:PspC domain-containing protein [Chloroflexaceae bacterium]